METEQIASDKEFEVSMPYKMHHDCKNKKIIIEYYDDIFKSGFRESPTEFYNSNSYVNNLLCITRVIDCYLKQSFFKAKS